MAKATGALRVLGIDVPSTLAEQWARWLAPVRQPFLVDASDPLADDSITCPLELTDTYEMYGLSRRGLSLTWLDEAAFTCLPRDRRAELVRSQVVHRRAAVPTVRAWGSRVGEVARSQADGHRFVWWPSLLGDHRDRVLTDFVTNDRLPSQHELVPAGVWKAGEKVLPGARQLAGTFLPASGPNCFGTVLAITGAGDDQPGNVVREPFEDWLAAATRPAPSGREIDNHVGTVFVWRSSDGSADHAGVALGGGWAMHKPSQGWMSPVKVLAVEDLKRRGRGRGLRLHRYRLVT